MHSLAFSSTPDELFMTSNNSDGVYRYGDATASIVSIDGLATGSRVFLSR